MKKLALNKEAIGELSTDELTGVVGGSHPCDTMPLNHCLSVQECIASHEPRCQVPTLANTCAC